MKRISWLIATLFFLLSTVFCFASSITVTLNSSATVKTQGMVKLADIADIQGTKEQIRSVGEVSVLLAPKPGSTKSIDADYIQRKLESARILNVNIDGASQVVVEGECVRIDSDELNERAVEYLEEMLPVLSDGFYSISSIRAADELVLPLGDNLEIVPRLMFREPKIGNNYVILDAKLDGRQVGFARVGLKVMVMVEALTATATIRKGELISHSNTALMQVEVVRGKEYLSAENLSETDPIVSSRTIMPGAPICAGDVSSQVVVKKGETVNLIVLCGNVKLATTALAKQDGCKGDNIAVRSEMSSGDIQARVIEPGLVEIKR